MSFSHRGSADSGSSSAPRARAVAHGERTSRLRTWLAIAIVGAVLALLIVPSAASGQVSTTRGWSFGLFLQGAGLTVEGSDEAAASAGAGFRIGYGINRRFTIFVRGDGSKPDVNDASIEGQWNLGHGEIGARFHFANSLRRVVPFLEAAVGARAVSVDGPTVEGSETDEELTFSGSAFSFGGGMGVHFSESWALDLGLVWSGGEFSQIDVGAVSVSGFDLDATSARLNLGIVWWP